MSKITTTSFVLPWLKYSKLREVPPLQSPFSISKAVDLLEIWCISSIDQSISTSQLANFFDDDLSISDDMEVPDFSTDIPSKISKEEFFNFVHQRLRYRCDKWEGKWPFVIEVHKKNINIEYQANFFSNNYITLLLCSNLHIIDRSYRHSFTSAFERLAFHHLSSIHCPKNGWITKSMGANNKSVHTYSGSTQRDKINALANDLRCPLNPYYRPTSSGDGGIDLVSFLSLDDSRSASSIAFGQCACTNNKKEILHKISETSADSIRDKLHIDSTPLNYLYSPLDLKSEIKPSGFDLDGTKSAIIIDRTRLLLKHFDCESVLDTDLKKYIYNLKTLKENYYEIV